MNDHDLENLIGSLKPAPLPDDLKARMSAEPRPPQKPRNYRGLFAATGVAAAAILVMAGIISILRPDRPADMASLPEEPNRPVSVVKKDSTLLNSRILSIEEHDGELWEVAEEEWRDDTLALYTGGPSRLRSTVIRREVVCSPLKFGSSAEFVGEFGFWKSSKCMKQGDSEQFEASIAVGFSHTQIDA